MTYLRNYPSICLKGMKKTMKPFSQAIWSPGKDMTPKIYRMCHNASHLKPASHTSSFHYRYRVKRYCSEVHQRPSNAFNLIVTVISNQHSCFSWCRSVSKLPFICAHKYADTHFVYGFGNGNGRAAAAEYRQRFPNGRVYIGTCLKTHTEVWEGERLVHSHEQMQNVGGNGVTGEAMYSVLFSEAHALFPRRPVL